MTLPLLEGGHRVQAYESFSKAVRALSDLPGSNLEVDEKNAAEFDGDRRYDIAFRDPPRSGALNICRILTGLEIPVLVYVSCDPQTLARDLTVLTEGGWALDSIRGFDMFPHTDHLETVAVLTRG